jgi:aspartate/methionine/tyrosine aminotransferase
MGDHIIVHAPGYQSHYEVARALGAQITLWMTQDSDNWELDLDALQKAIRPNTRAILINCPHNPTGYQMSEAKLGQIVEIAQQHNLIVFSDEVYRWLEHEPGTTLSGVCDLDERAVSLGALSKTYGMAGLRIGWIATRDTALYQQMLTLKDYTTICNSAPSEFLSCIALRHREAIAERNLGIIRANLDRLDEFFARHSEVFAWKRPKAGSTAFPRLKGGLSSAAFCREAVEKQGVMLLPSTCFDYGDAHLRIGFGRRNMPEALERLERMLTD